jgi:hypothetical protein
MPALARLGRKDHAVVGSDGQQNVAFSAGFGQTAKRSMQGGIVMLLLSAY